MPVFRRRTLSLAAASAALLAVAPPAIADTKSTLSGSISPVRVKPGAPLNLTIGFTLDPTERGADPATLTQIVIDFPKNAVHNGRLFPSCSAAAINARQNFSACPKGSQIGRGTGRADTPAVDVYNVPVRFTLFNARGGKAITIHVYAENPIVVNHAFEAPIKRVRGRYGYRLTAKVPEILQEINGKGGGWFVGLRKFRSTVGGTRVVKGKRRGFIEAKSCPRGGRAPIAARFSFLRDSAPSSARSWIRCMPR